MQVSRVDRFLSSLRDFAGVAAFPAMNRWATLGRPSGTVAMETDDPVTSDLGFDRRQVPQLYGVVTAARCERQPLGTLEEYQASNLVDVTFESLK
jgi:hypothetical protein